MDRALIERMVGAVVLVLLLVVVAPALLDGRRVVDRESRDSGDDGSTRTEVIVLNAPLGERQASLPDAGDEPAKSAAQPTPIAEPAPIVESKAPSVVDKMQPPQLETSARPEGYAVQIGSFGNKSNADQFAAGLSKEGYAVFVASAMTTSGTVYRVNAGPRATRAEAEKLAATISKSGRSAMVVELDSKSNGGSH